MGAMAGRRRTKVLVTLGPATAQKEVLEAVLQAGADGVRLNFSYGDHDQHTRMVALVRHLEGRLGRPVAVVQDLQGPKVRIGPLVGPRPLRRGEEVVLSLDGGEGVPVHHPGMELRISPGDRLLLGDGEAELEVAEVLAGRVRAVVVRGGTLRPGQGLHLPGRMLGQGLTPKDEADLALGLSLGVDYVALSFVRGPEDVRRLRAAMRRRPRPWVIAKLERREALARLRGILALAEGVMVARGDLGLDMPPEELPLLQKRIIASANQRGVLVITATQMLESMVHSPRPTRAEVSDVANAILDGSDAVMLSAETAVGDYPVEAVATACRIAQKTDPRVRPGHREGGKMGFQHALARAASRLARDLGAAAIAVFTRRGRTAQLMSKERPSVPVFAFTPSREVWRRLALWWGVEPLLRPWPATAREMRGLLDAALLEAGLSPGDLVVVLRWAPGAAGWDNFLHLHRLGR